MDATGKNPGTFGNAAGIDYPQVVHAAYAEASCPEPPSIVAAPRSWRCIAHGGPMPLVFDPFAQLVVLSVYRSWEQLRAMCWLGPSASSLKRNRASFDGFHDGFEILTLWSVPSSK